MPELPCTCLQVTEKLDTVKCSGGAAGRVRLWFPTSMPFAARIEGNQQLHVDATEFENGLQRSDIEGQAGKSVLLRHGGAAEGAASVVVAAPDRLEGASVTVAARSWKASVEHRMKLSRARTS